MVCALGLEDLSQSDAQRLTGLAYSTINEMCNNRTRRIDFDTIDVLCSALGCTVADIIEYVPRARGGGTRAAKR
ncbi:MAG: helix-turn-helix domain-containing protein [Gemmatimonadaceae bacterium]